MTTELAAMRGIVADGVLQNPVIILPDPAMAERLLDPAGDCNFDELGFDSLARMELCIWLQLEHGIEIGEAVLIDHPSVLALARYLSAR